MGINVGMAADYIPEDLTDITDHMFLLAQPDNPHVAEAGWDAADVAGNTKVVGWFLCDEPDIGLAGFIATDDEFGWLAVLEDLAATSRALNDGRFVFTNLSNGIFNTFWSTNVFTDMIGAVDGCCIDVYAYTRPSLNVGYTQSVEWTSLGGNEANSISSAAYGWLAKRMSDEQPATRRPTWVFCETKMPFLDEVNSRIILYAQIEGAAWASICNEARGISYFQHNGFYPGGLPVNDPNTGAAHCTSFSSLNDCEAGLQTAVSAINAKIRSLAPVINTQSFVFSFDATGVDTMLKVYQGHIYIFACLGIAAATGSKTFTLPKSVKGKTVTVMSEDRTIAVSAGRFTDTFASETSHHVYKVRI